MKIGIFTNNYLPNPYGVSGSIESFRKQFEAMGHAVYIFAPAWKNYIDENPNVFRYPSLDIEFKFRFPLGIPYSRKMDKILEKLDLDIIHSQHPNLLGSAAAKWAKKKNIPLVFTWHTLYDQYAHFFPFVPRNMAANWFIKKAVKYADRSDQIITPTSSVIGIIKKWGVKNKNITAIPTGVEEKIYADPDRNYVREKYAIKEDEVLLLLVSRLTEEKNIRFLLDAAILVLENNPRVKFLITGGGYLLPELKESVKKHNLEKQVLFEGVVRKEELKNYYAAGDIFVYASKSETQGMIMTEAMYSGLPIVAVRAAGSLDIVINNETGFLVSESADEFAQAVEKLIADKNLRESFAQEAKRIAQEKYTSRICAQKMLEVYEKAIQNFKKKVL